MKSITYVKGNVVEPQTENDFLIPHIVNDIGAWGSGVVIAISNRWNGPESTYRTMYDSRLLRLGETQFIQVETKEFPKCLSSNGFVANMVAQKGTGKVLYNLPNTIEILPPIRYEALRECMCSVADYCIDNNLEIHAPKFGSLRSGGDWDVIEGMIDEIWCFNDISVTIYEYVE